MNYIVTGGAGFIGSHLCEKLLLNGDTVTTVDNFNSYYCPSIKRANIACVEQTAQKAGASFSLVEGDIRDAAVLESLFSRPVDIVIHLAAMAGVRPSIEAEALYWEVNVMGTQKILEACRMHGVKRMVFISSSSVYGNSPTVPFAVTDNVDRPISPYAATKKAGELLCYTHHHLYDMNIACMRLFTVFGPRQRPDLAINKFTRLILADEPITVFGDGTTSRDYTFVSDITDGLMRAAAWTGSKEARYGIFNLGGDHPVSLSEMIETIERVLGMRARIERVPMQPGDVDRTCADISVSRNLLGYSPKVSFEEGIASFADWYQNTLYKG